MWRWAMAPTHPCEHDLCAQITARGESRTQISSFLGWREGDLDGERVALGEEELVDDAGRPQVGRGFEAPAKSAQPDQ